MTAATKTTSLAFPHDPLTPIQGPPDNTTVTRLKRELYENAISIASTHGGGALGHLGLVTTDAEFAAFAGNNAAGVPNVWTLPAHPGPAPVHAAQATAAQIAEAIRLYDRTIKDLTVADEITRNLKKLLIDAVEPAFLAVLANPTLGFANVPIPTILTHLHDTYCTIDADELERNRDGLKTAWNIDDNIEKLWARHVEIRRIATAGNAPINDDTVIGITIKMFKDTGVFDTACEMWRNKPATDRTYANFMSFFAAENKERLKKLTASQAGYHGANLANPAVVPAAANTATVVTNCETRMYYCWTHGLGLNSTHTSATCTNRAEGHKDDATVSNMQGGCNLIMGPRTGRRRAANR